MTVASLKKSQAELKRLAGPLLGALERSGVAIVVTDPRLPDNPIVFASHAFEQLTLYMSAEIIGRNCRFLQTPDTSIRAIETIRTALDTGSEAEVVLLNARKDGSPFWNKLTITTIRGARGEVAFLLGPQVDV